MESTKEIMERNTANKKNEFDLLPEEVKEKGKNIFLKHKDTNLELCQILDVDAELYEGISIEELNFSARVKNSLVQPLADTVVCKTVADVLHLSIPEFKNSFYIGIRGYAEIIIMTQKFIDKKKYFPVRPPDIYDRPDIYKKRLGYAFNHILKGKDYDESLFEEDEQEYINGYKRAFERLDNDLLTAALNRDKYLNQIITALYMFSEPTVNYIAYADKIDAEIDLVPDCIRHKPLKLLLMLYPKSGGFLLSIKDDIKLVELPKYITKAEVRDRDTRSLIEDFLDWLNINFITASREIIKPFKYASDLEKEILREKSRLKYYKVLGKRYNLLEDEVKDIYTMMIRNIRSSYRYNRYDIFVVIFLMTGRKEMGYDDIKFFSGKEAADCLWSFVNASPFDFNKKLYRFDSKKKKIIYYDTIDEFI